jgi:hypothetical protein
LLGPDVMAVFIECFLNSLRFKVSRASIFHSNSMAQGSLDSGRRVMIGKLNFHQSELIPQNAMDIHQGPLATRFLRVAGVGCGSLAE